MASETVLGRYEGNPVIVPDRVQGANGIFHSACVPHGHGYAGTFRVDETDRETAHVGPSADGIPWGIEPHTLRMV